VRRADLILALALVCAGAACSGRADEAERVPEPPPTVIAPIDAGLVDGTTALPTFDPNADIPIDDAPANARNGTGTRSRRTVEILLRSTPPGATVIVDGLSVGKTPTYWEGEFTGRAREFTFRLPGYTVGRYKFVPISNGIVHATLDPALSPIDVAQSALTTEKPAPQRRPPPLTPSAPAADARPAAISSDAAAAPPASDGSGSSGSGSGSGSRPRVGPTP
jgi:hypothetical protein